MHQRRRSYLHTDLPDCHELLQPSFWLHFGGSACECDSVLGPVFSQIIEF